MSLLGKAALVGGLITGGWAAKSAYQNSPDEDRVRQAAGLGIYGASLGAAGVWGLSKTPFLYRNIAKPIAKMAFSSGKAGIKVAKTAKLGNAAKFLGKLNRLGLPKTMAAGFSRIPAKGILLPALAGLAVFGAAKSMSTSEIESSATPEPDGRGGYSYQTSGVGERLRTMNSTGDMVFGLHRGRH